MTLTREEVRRIAGLARLDLTVEEEQRFAVQLGRVVEYIGQLDRFETSEFPPGVPDGALALDEPVASLPTEAVLANAPQRIFSFVVVPRVLEADD